MTVMLSWITDQLSSINYVMLLNQIIFYVYVSITGLLIYRTYRYVRSLNRRMSSGRGKGTPESNAQTFQNEMISQINDINEKATQIQVIVDSQNSDSISIQNGITNLKSELDIINRNIRELDSSQERAINGILKTMPKPSPYIRFPVEYQEVYQNLEKRVIDVINKAETLNNSYDVKIFEDILSFALSEVRDIPNAQVSLENLAGRLAVIERLLNNIEASFENPNVIRRMKKLQEDGFREKLALQS